MHRVAEVFGEGERQDNRRDAEDGQRRGGAPNLGYGAGLLIGEDHNGLDCGLHGVRAEKCHRQYFAAQNQDQACHLLRHTLRTVDILTLRGGLSMMVPLLVVDDVLGIKAQPGELLPNGCRGMSLQSLLCTAPLRHSIFVFLFMHVR